ncbi:MAG: methyltransferase domain-containing protein [Pseudonocardia sediminis]
MTTRFENMRTRTLPELHAGGYSRIDGGIEFFLRVNALLEPGFTVLDLGAGRGDFVEDPVAFRRDLNRIRGKVRHVVGLDVDPVVTDNPGLDEAHVIGPDGGFPLADASVDLIVSDFTFEHIRDPARSAAEMRRVLRPRGWICARTPNKWGAIALPARAVPNRLHDAVLARVQPDKQARDTFPTAYRLNTSSALHRHFPDAHFRHCSYTHESEPAYTGRSTVAWTAFRALAAITPPPLRTMHMVFLQKID